MSPPAQHVMISFRCRNDACGTRLEQAADRPGPVEVPCPRCGSKIALDFDADLVERRSPRRCPCCGGVEFFVRKDFPQKLGMALVVVFGLIATVFFAYRNVIATFATLAALVVVDAFIYLFVGRATVCYKCRAEFRGVAYNPEHGPFNLATSEKY